MTGTSPIFKPPPPPPTTTQTPACTVSTMPLDLVRSLHDELESLRHIGALSKEQQQRQTLLEATVSSLTTIDAEPLSPGQGEDAIEGAAGESPDEPAECDTGAPLGEAPRQDGDAIEGAAEEFHDEPAECDAEVPGQGEYAVDDPAGTPPDDPAAGGAEAPLADSPMCRETTQLLNRFNQAITEFSPNSKALSQRLFNNRLQMAANEALHWAAAAKTIAGASARAAGNETVIVQAGAPSRVLVSPAYGGKKASRRRLDKVDKRGIQKNARKRTEPRKRFETVSELHAQELAAAASSQVQEESLVDGNVHLVNQLKGARRFKNTKQRGLVAMYWTQYETGVTEWTSTEELSGHGSR